MTEETTLLREYAATRSQRAFARLVELYVDLVYSAARRQVHGDAHLAEDVTQAVFIVLAQKARSVPVDRPLSSWLLKVTGYCAANARRNRQRRETHERRAAEMAPIHDGSETEADWETLSPLLDQGLSKLPAADRDALLLRFFEKKSLRQVGEAMGISEEAAQKRVTRAVEKLRDYFRRRGATVGAGALAALLTTESIKAAPAGLSGTVTAAAAATTSTTAAAAAGGSSTAAAAAAAKGAMVAMAIHKTAVVTAAGLVLLLGIGGGAMAIRSMVGGSNRIRQVTVPTPPPAPNRSTVVFSDGSTASVLGIAETSSPPSGNWLGTLLGSRGRGAAKQPTQWWSTDGSAQPAPKIPVMTGQLSAGDSVGRRQVMFVFALSGPAASDTSLAVRIPNINGNASSSQSDGGQQFEHFVCSLPETLDRTDIRLGISRGPWREDASIAPATTTQPTTRTAGGRYFTKISEIGTDVVVEIDQNRTPFRGSDRDVRMTAVLKNGKSVNAHEWRGFPGGRGEVRFRCRLDQLDRVAFTTRPYEWQTIGNVALKPPAQPTTTTTTTTRVASGK